MSDGMGRSRGPGPPGSPAPRGRWPARGRIVVSAACTLLTALGLAAAASGQEPEAREPPRSVEFESGFALLAARPATGVTAAAAVSTRVAVGSDGLLVEPGTGAVYVAGRHAGRAAREIMGRLRDGEPPSVAADAAATAESSGPGPLQAAVLGRDCAAGRQTAPWAREGSEARSGETADGVCYLAVVTQPRDSLRLSRLVSSFRSSAAALPERLMAALGETSRMVDPEARVSRSASLWVSGGEGALGRGELRLQVEDHPRPVAQLGRHMSDVRADALVTGAGEALAAGEYEQALARADSALELDPAVADAWMERGRALLYLERPDEAETALRRMLELDPRHLRFLGDPTEPAVNEEVIPYEPRLLLRLDVYRRAFFRDLDFRGSPAPYDSIPSREDASGSSGASP